MSQYAAYIYYTHIQMPYVIAHSVVRHLIRPELRCRTLFATHYHKLVEDFGDGNGDGDGNGNGNGNNSSNNAGTSEHRGVSLGHMACHLEATIVGNNATTADDDKDSNLCVGIPKVTFLYKLRGGACPKSHGLNVARLARLPMSIVRRAHEKSVEFEQTLLAVKNKGTTSVGVGAGAGAGGQASGKQAVDALRALFHSEGQAEAEDEVKNYQGVMDLWRQMRKE